MPRWKIDTPKRRAFSEIFGGLLVVTRNDAGELNSVWKSDALPDYPAGFCTGLAHVGCFAIDPRAVQALTAEEGQTMLHSKWEGLGLQRPWVETPRTRAFEMRLHGWRGLTSSLDEPEHAGAALFALPTGETTEEGEPLSWIPGAACWLAPLAIKTHLAATEPRYFRTYAEENPPGLFVASQDPI